MRATYQGVNVWCLLLCSTPALAPVNGPRKRMASMNLTTDASKVCYILIPCKCKKGSLRNTKCKLLLNGNMKENCFQTTSSSISILYAITIINIGTLKIQIRSRYKCDLILIPNESPHLIPLL